MGSKIAAIVLNVRLTPICESLDHETQCGFRPGRGTADASFKISAFFLIDDTWRETLLALRRHHDVAGDYVRTFAQIDEMFEQDASTQRLLHNVGVSKRAAQASMVSEHATELADIRKQLEVQMGLVTELRSGGKGKGKVDPLKNPKRPYRPREGKGGKGGKGVKRGGKEQKTDAASAEGVTVPSDAEGRVTHFIDGMPPCSCGGKHLYRDCTSGGGNPNQKAQDASVVECVDGLSMDDPRFLCAIADWFGGEHHMAAVTEMSDPSEVTVVPPIAYKLEHGLQKSKFVFSQAELARCMNEASKFYAVGSRGYVGIFFGHWYLVSQYVLGHPKLWSPDGPMLESVKKHGTEVECLDYFFARGCEKYFDGYRTSAPSTELTKYEYNPVFDEQGGEEKVLGGGYECHGNYAAGYDTYDQLVREPSEGGYDSYDDDNDDDDDGRRRRGHRVRRGYASQPSGESCALLSAGDERRRSSGSAREAARRGRRVAVRIRHRLHVGLRLCRGRHLLTPPRSGSRDPVLAV